MTHADYRKFVVGKAMLPAFIENQDEVGLLLGALGLAGEAGEVVDQVKKLVFHRHDYEQVRTKLLDEMGDVLWYFEWMCHVLGFSVDAIMERNVQKLTERYGDGVATPERSINRTV